MAIRGRKPKPTALKLVTGNAGKRPLNNSEPQPKGEVVKPKFLTGVAGVIWDQYAPELIRLGTLTFVDIDNFALWCKLAAKMRKQFKYMTASEMAQMRAIGSAFGMDASSRTRLGTNADDKPQDPAEGYFAQNA